MKGISQDFWVLFLLLLPGIGHAALSDYFVSTDWLAKQGDKVVVVDVRREPFYLLGHIDGAHIKTLVKKSAREIANKLKADQVDLVLLTPA